jgi:MOSC domain-containing protein YiiM
VPVLQSVNVGAVRRIRAKSGVTGIDKVPTSARVAVLAPAPQGVGGSGLAGDVICDTKSHGGDDQAVYAFAREDLDWWESELDRPLRSGMFGENVTTSGLDVTQARVGERWRIGDQVVLEVTGPRIPCVTFATWMDVPGWLKSFTRRARPGAYLRVASAGSIGTGDPLVVDFRPDHGVTVGTMFRALTLERDLLPALLAASDYLDEETIDRARKREPYEIDGV